MKQEGFHAAIIDYSGPSALTEMKTLCAILAGPVVSVAVP